MIPGAQAYSRVDYSNVPAYISLQPTVNGDTTTYLPMLYEDYLASGSTARYTTMKGPLLQRLVLRQMSVIQLTSGSPAVRGSSLALHLLLVY
jgi:hypothetical protein